MRSDKELELERYENRAREALAGNPKKSVAEALEELPPALRAPYVCYQSQIANHITDAGMKVLEIGAGTGMFTEMILQSGAQLVATDISRSALEVLSKRLADYANLETQVADMESLPFEDACFDAVLCAGSLSYGDNRVVMNEINRVLKPGGRFICVDSLNHNPVYRFNRWLQYLRGRRTRSTIERMPTEQLIRAYRDEFGRVSEWYFGSVTWLVPILNIFMGAEKVGSISDKIDRFINVGRSAFKFVMVVHK